MKFWGKSMGKEKDVLRLTCYLTNFIEIFPDSLNTIFFPKYNETITWNKCTMCIHNVLSADRWIDHYGDVVVESSLGTKSRISFIQVEKNLLDSIMIFPFFFFFS